MEDSSNIPDLVLTCGTNAKFPILSPDIETLHIELLTPISMAGPDKKKSQFWSQLTKPGPAEPCCFEPIGPLGKASKK